MPSPCPVFLNPAAGGAARRDDLAAALALCPGAELCEAPPEELGPRVRAAARAGAPWVGVAGGDGSVAAAAGALAGTGVPLAVFPCGTLNHFAAALGLADCYATAQAIAAARVREVDVGEVDGRVFVNGASLGLYPRQLELRRRWQPWLGKWPAAALASLVVLVTFPRRGLRLEAPGLRFAGPVPRVWIGPGRGSFRDPRQAPRELASGVLEVVVVAAASRWRLVDLAVRALRRGGDALQVCRRVEDCAVHHAPQLVVHRRRRDGPLEVGLDGELHRLTAPLLFRVQPRALRVFVGPDRAAEA